MKTILCFLALVLLCSSANSQIVWQRDTLNPIIPVWFGDVNIPTRLVYSMTPDVFYDSNTDLYHLWFTSLSYNASVFCVSEALSTDGRNWFLNARNPVLRPTGGAFDQAGIIYPCVVKEPQGYKMYYSGNWGRLEIGVATSSDGLTWTKYQSTPIIQGGGPGTWNYTLRDPSVIFDEGIYKMWFEGRNGYPSSIGYATSLDGFTWSLHAGNPILGPGTPGGFEEMGVGEPCVIKVGTVYHMIYTGYTNQLIGRLGYAISNDGITWTKYQGNPVLDHGGSGQWDGAYVASSSLLYKDGKFHLWYTGTNGTDHQTGHAVSDPLTSAELSELFPENDGANNTFRLVQNFPNPFNPSTTIAYSLPSKGTIQLVIFDILGHEVTTLVAGVQERGEHSVIWDGKNNHGTLVASGNYMAKVQFVDNAGKQKTLTQKLLLLK